MPYSDAYDPQEGIAIVGMAGRFPGARDVAQFWRNLLDGRETISRFGAEELDPASADEAAARGSPDYVPARGILDDAEMFDAGFFGINPKEAEVLDPQQRVFLETAWEALEDAGYDPQTFGGPIGVFAGSSNNYYYLENLLNRRDATDIVGWLTTMMGNEKDYLTTRVAYKLDLKGPALNIQTACSTSLVAVCAAVQSLLSYQCDMALAGGVSVTLPQRRGYLWQEGGILSPDGHCRAFDRDARGTVFSNGVGIVVLRRLRDALADGDTIYAIIKGAALNNDGNSKVSFMAPSVDGHGQLISMAQALGGIDPETISYIEAHGTGTALGDPIEIAGLTQAFHAGGARGKGFCAIGSLKTNVGHLDAAAGVGGLIKTALALYHKVLPASLHFHSPNPKFQIEESPFYVNAGLQPWREGPTPRRAGVSSFGVGGTNSHVVLEEAPAAEAGDEARNRQLLVLSARSAEGLDRAAVRLREQLAAEETVNMADAAYTLQVGRRPFSHRRAIVCRDRREALELLAQSDPRRVFSGSATREPGGVAFLFPGQGAQYVNMGRTLYESEKRFRTEIDECCEVLRPYLDVDLRAILYPPQSGIEKAQERITQTAVTQPALFVIEYALAQLWMSWGVQPVAMIGHSLGEYVAACLAGVFARDDALRLLAQRARMMQDLPPGSMLAVRASLDAIAADLGPEASVAALNSPSLTVISGDHGAIAELEARLTAREIDCRRLLTSHAFHSPMIEPVVAGFAECVRAVPRAAPKWRWVSSLTGEWITDAEAVDPAYWVQQMRQTVRFMDGIGLLMDPSLVLLEVGPGQALTILARQHPKRKAEQIALTSLDPGQEFAADLDYLLAGAGRLWTVGIDIDWAAFHAPAKRRRISLPTYPFERRRYWVSPGFAAGSPFPMGAAALGDGQSTAIAEPVVMTKINREANMPDNFTRAPDTGRLLQVEKLRLLFSELSGIDADSLNPDLTFLELGLDSLFLTRLVAELKKRFGVRVLFRRLFEDLTTIKQIAIHLAQEAPSRFAPSAEPPTQTPAINKTPMAQGTPTALSEMPYSSGEMGLLLQRQLELVKQQVDILSQQLIGLRGASKPARTSIPVVGGSIGQAAKQPVAYSLAASMRNASMTAAAAHREEFGVVRADLDSLCTALVVNFFRSSGIPLEARTTLSRDKVMAALGVRSPYGKLIDYFFKILRDDGLVEGDSQDKLTVTAAISAVKTPGAVAAEIEKRHSSFSALCKLLDNCAAGLPEVLRGELPGVAVLLPDGTRTMINEVFQTQTPDYRGVVGVEDALARELLKLAAIKPIRILEVGGGGGDLMWRIASQLPAGAHYHFTDLGRTFVEDARKRGSSLNGARMSYSVVDITKSLLEQGIESASFDVIVALDVIHVAPDVATALENLFVALAPGGVVCAIESVGTYRWDQMIWGLTPQWWLFADSIRKHSPLMDLAEWQAAVKPLKLESFEWFPATPANNKAHDSRLLLLRPESAAIQRQMAMPKARERLSVVPAANASADKPAHGPYRPMDRGSAGTLTPAQRKRLDALITRYVQRTAESKRLTEASRPHLADPRSVAGYRQVWKELVYPIVVERSSGSKLWDVDGNEYIDLICGFGPILLGHNPAIVREAIKSQLEQGIETGPQTPLAGKVAQLFCEMTGMQRVAFCNTGSEAVLAAIRVARTVTGRDLIAMFSGAYHGIFDEVLVRAANADGISRPIPVAPGIPSNMAENILVLEYGSPAALDVIEARGQELAAVLVEPVQSRRPELQPRDFVKRLRALTEASGTALIMDEVVTGFRTHPGGIQALWQLRADLASYGKVVGGGLPIGLVAGSTKFMDALDGGMWRYGDDSFPEVGVTYFAGTFVRHPLALTAAQAVLSHLKSEGPELQRRLNLRTTQLVEALTRQAAVLAAPIRITHFSSWFCINLPPELPFAPLLYPCMRARGIHVWEGRCGFITTAHTDADLERVVQAFRDSIIELQAADFLPGGEEQPPMSGARKGRDPSGRHAWFVADPNRPGKYLQVDEGVGAHE